MPLPEPERLRKWAELTGLGPLLAASVLVGWLFGSWLDSKFGTSPWLMTGGLFLGALGGFIEVARILVRLGEGPGRRGGRKRGGGGGGEPPAAGAGDPGKNTGGTETKSNGSGSR